MKVNANFRLFASRHFDSSQYMASPAYGVNRFLLDRIGDEKARATSIVEYQPHSTFPSHTHIGGEEFLVLDGVFQDEFGTFPAGTYVRNPIDSVHAPWVGETGCTIFVKLLQMSSEDHLTSPLYVNLEDARKTATTKDWGQVAELYANPPTGERVQLCWVAPHHRLPTDPAATEGGEELLVVRGSLQFENQVYEKWAWLRFPVGGRGDLTAGPQGAEVYRKTGHLTDVALSKEKIQIKD